VVNPTVPIELHFRGKQWAKNANYNWNPRVDHCYTTGLYLIPVTCTFNCNYLGIKHSTKLRKNCAYIVVTWLPRQPTFSNAEGDNRIDIQQIDADSFITCVQMAPRAPSCINYLWLVRMNMKNPSLRKRGQCTSIQTSTRPSLHTETCTCFPPGYAFESFTFYPRYKSEKNRQVNITHNDLHYYAWWGQDKS
jgi:hypothetical protein